MIQAKQKTIIGTPPSKSIIVAIKCNRTPSNTPSPCYPDKRVIKSANLVSLGSCFLSLNAAATTCLFLFWTSRTLILPKADQNRYLSSIESFITNLKTVTRLVWPSRFTRSTAWSSIEGAHQLSAIITWLAAARFNYNKFYSLRNIRPLRLLADWQA